jgi:hypothetical protein
MRTFMYTCSPTWDQIKIPLVTLSGGDVYRPLLVEVFGWNKSGAHTLWASCNISVNDCMTPQKAFQLTPQGKVNDVFVNKNSSMVHRNGVQW